MRQRNLKDIIEYFKDLLDWEEGIIEGSEEHWQVVLGLCNVDACAIPVSNYDDWPISSNC